MKTYGSGVNPLTRLAIVNLATSDPMGQQNYENQIAKRAPGQLDESWEVRRLIVRTLRSSLQGEIRIPAKLLGHAAPVTRRLAGRLLFHGYDLVHRLDLRIPPTPGKDIVTVHDLASLHFDDEGEVPRDSAASCERSLAVICPSEFSANEIAARFHIAKPFVVSNGVDADFFSATPLIESKRAELGIAGPYVLHAGGCSTRKNLAGLAAAWPLVRSAHPDASLVLVGPSDARRDVLFGPLPGVIRLGRVARELVIALFGGAGVVVVPSLYEGFGLPVVEAMAAGVPVVAAHRASLPEVCGDGALLVEPSGSGLADGIVAALDGGPSIDTLVERGRRRAVKFTWQASAEAHANIWRAVRG
ncbi:MAG: glycosyltransferase family 4 protein [Deltaproteobacteria bacterium]